VKIVYLPECLSESSTSVFSRSQNLKLFLPFALVALSCAATSLFAQEKSLDSFLRAGTPQSPEEIQAMERHLEELVQRLSPATVSVSGGSGVVVSKDGYILTVGHVGQRAGRKVKVVFPDGKRVNAVTLGNNESVDAGMMKIVDEGDYPFVPLGKSEDLERGQWCLAIGFPVSFNSGEQPAVRLGRVLRNSRQAIISDCLIMGGDSGGPLFDLQGNLIGISSRVSGELNGNVHVPIDAYTQDWDRYVASEDWNDRDRRRRPVSEQTGRSYLGVNIDRGFTDAVRVSDVRSNSPAAKAGIQTGDLIEAIDEKVVSNLAEVLNLLSAKKPGEAIVIKLKRDAEQVLVNVTLGERD
jgi:serine protease Do